MKNYWGKNSLVNFKHNPVNIITNFIKIGQVVSEKMGLNNSIFSHGMHTVISTFRVTMDIKIINFNLLYLSENWYIFYGRPE